MPLTGEYEPSPSDWARDQVERIEKSGGTEGAENQGHRVIVLTTVGAKSGKLRKTPLMRVEHDGEWALVASMGGAPTHPVWYYNLVAHPDAVVVQDGPTPVEVTVREASGDEKARWWDWAVEAYPPYADYQAKTDRQIPLFIATPKVR